MLDGLVHEARSKHVVARSQLYHEQTDRLGDFAPLLACQDWILYMKCISHASSLALRWAVSEQKADLELDELKLGIYALINSKTAIVAEIRSFVETRLRFRPDRSGTVMEITAF